MTRPFLKYCKNFDNFVWKIKIMRFTAQFIEHLTGTHTGAPLQGLKYILFGKTTSGCRGRHPLHRQRSLCLLEFYRDKIHRLRRSVSSSPKISGTTLIFREPYFILPLPDGNEKIILILIEDYQHNNSRSRNHTNGCYS